eukprot:6196973-Pleurochrysis_carterae.AAC.1
MMNWARIQMKTWTGRKNEHKVNVQGRWDNRRTMMNKTIRRRQKEIRGQRKGKRRLRNKTLGQMQSNTEISYKG